MSSQIPSKMLFAEKIRQLREENQLLQRQVSAALEIDNALYCKIERGDRLAKRGQVVKLAELFNVESEELLVLWLADQVMVMLKDEKEIVDKVLEKAQQELIK
ncbi:MAG: helix-turn-helix domain-containing protein [Synergistaceae bacterium]|jgi:transcriptional regulator with XRE-family HTH domain|nr:helix-turn-helix domain-containing protein [Synergistaceae bacterium]